ncbi:hypothetical protein [Planomonospora sp. ID82291]|uniref:hypothetical protein n=1 Tax=Planomonospora sp. ID82291 TaxID=2738136 RepID=UPI0018C42785|nr:hypothetical protein [Planomonospora sp. ID82291]MBG0818298.1 hypothetical protein [Planomonospora sp. ID82291]
MARTQPTRYTEKAAWDYAEPSRTAPAPTVTFDGQRAVLSGVRFQHTDHCWGCRYYITAYTENGTVEIELKTSRAGATAWQRREAPGSHPSPPSACPWCERAEPLPARSAFAGALPSGGASGCPAGGTIYPAEQAAYDYLRATFPTLAAAADRADGIR